MTDSTGTGPPWSIGELAEACGVTVRALHHYDSIGLLSAGIRTPSGHRRYTEQDLRRLYRIRALQMLGLPLADVGQALDATDDTLTSLRALLEQQLAHMRRHMDEVQALERRLGDLLSRLDEPAMPTTEQFLSTLEMITMLEKHFTPEQRQDLADRRTELGADRIEQAKRRWTALVEEGLGYATAGAPVSGPEVQEWVRNWDEVGSMFHTGEQTKAAARAAWQANSEALGANLPWTAADLAGLMAYLHRARTQPAAGES
jgi:DNA-binding transcriptional MerR regulator